jgi:hypothetical protein
MAANIFGVVIFLFISLYELLDFRAGILGKENGACVKTVHRSAADLKEFGGVERSGTREQNIGPS